MLAYKDSSVVKLVSRNECDQVAVFDLAGAGAR